MNRLACKDTFEKILRYYSNQRFAKRLFSKDTLAVCSLYNNDCSIRYLYAFPYSNVHKYIVNCTQKKSHKFPFDIY